MAHQTSGLHHALMRKRIHVNHEQFPHPNKLKRFMDDAMYVVGMIAPLMIVPQVVKIWQEKSAQNISALTWGSFALVSLFWVFYGILHKEKPVVLTHGALVIMNGLVVVLTLLYN